jgi:aminoglycoside 6-adenylyltransferase
MRSEEEVLDMLVAWAQHSDCIRAMRITGSRGDPTRPPDDLSDYDVEVFVRNRNAFEANESWVDAFGEVMVRWPLHPSRTLDGPWTTQLVLYQDGVRIDFQITDESPAATPSLGGTYRILVDKDRAFSADVPADPFALCPPDGRAFAERVNAFWWDIVYVPKALCRDELNLAKSMLEGTIRFDKLRPLIEWYIGTTVGWEVRTGLSGRWFKRHLSPELWRRYERTFAGSDLDDNWRALYATIGFTRTIARAVARALAFTYPERTDALVTAYIETLHARYRAGRPRDRSS